MVRAIVKVELVEGGQWASVRDREGRFVLRVPATPALHARMGVRALSRAPIYFVADIMSSAVDLIDDAPEQEW